MNFISPLFSVMVGLYTFAKQKRGHCYKTYRMELFNSDTNSTECLTKTFAFINENSYYIRLLDSWVLSMDWCRNRKLHCDHKDRYCRSGTLRLHMDRSYLGTYYRH